MPGVSKESADPTLPAHAPHLAHLPLRPRGMGPDHRRCPAPRPPCHHPAQGALYGLQDARGGGVEVRLVWDAGANAMLGAGTGREGRDE